MRIIMVLNPSLGIHTLFLLYFIHLEKYRAVYLGPIHVYCYLSTHIYLYIPL